MVPEELIKFVRAGRHWGKIGLMTIHGFFLPFLKGQPLRAVGLSRLKNHLLQGKVHTGEEDIPEKPLAFPGIQQGELSGIHSQPGFLPQFPHGGGEAVFSGFCRAACGFPPAGKRAFFRAPPGADPLPSAPLPGRTSPAAGDCCAPGSCRSSGGSHRKYPEAPKDSLPAKIQKAFNPIIKA